MIDETTKHNRAKGYYKRIALAGDTTGAFQELVTFNKLASAETDKIKAMINKKFGPGSMKYGSEIKQPEIKTPQAIFEFTQRNPAAEGGRIGFKDGLSVDVYNTVYDEYVDLVETGLKNNKLIDTPTWESFVKSKGYKSPSLMYYADKPAPTTLLREKKLELAKKLIDAENLKLDGKWKMHKDGASSIFQGKIFNNRLNQKPGTIEGDVGRLVNKYLDSKDDKIKRAFNYIMNPEYKMTASGETGVAHEIQRLIAPDTVKGRITKDIRKTLEAIPEYKEIEDKLKYINRIITKVPKGTDMSMGYLMEMAENNKLGRANFEDWWKLAGDKPEQFAMREVVRNWNNSQGEGDFKLYDLNGKELKWKGKDTKLNTNKILFSYADPENLGYKNKLYSFFKPDAKTLATINKAVPNEGVFDLKGNIRKLGEFNELVEVVDGRNKLFNTEMIDPFTGEKSTYKKVYENIYKRINTTAYGTKEGYSKIKSMAGQIDHDFGSKKYPFNNLRISTGQQNLMFKALVDAAENNKALEPYVRALEAEMYTGGSIDDQIKAIVNETNELGKVVKNAPGKITIPTATETAAFKFLKNKIPNLPESVIKYLQPKADVAEKIFKETPDLDKVYQRQILNYITDTTGKVKQPMLPSGLAGAYEMMSDDLKAIVNSPEFKKFYASKTGKALSMAARTPTKLFGLADVLFGYLDYTNNEPMMSKAKAWQNMWQAMSFGIYRGGDKQHLAEIKQKFIANGGDGDIFDQVIELNKSNFEMKNYMENMKKEYQDLTAAGYTNLAKDKMNSAMKNVVKMGNKNLDLFEQYKTDLAVSEAGSPIQMLDVMQPAKDAQKAGFELLEEEQIKNFPTTSKQLRTESGPVANKLFNAYWTKDAWKKFLPQNIFFGNFAGPVTDKEKQDALIKNMEPRERYLYNLARGQDPDNPITLDETAKFMDANKKILGYSIPKAEGGITQLRSKYEYKK